MYALIVAAVIVFCAIVVEIGFGGIDIFWKKILGVIVAILVIFGVLSLAGVLPFRY